MTPGNQPSEADTELGLTAAANSQTAIGSAATTPAPGSRSAGQRSSPVGSQLAGRYEVVARIGAGGMGEVYLAEHTTIQKQVAIKILGSDFTHRADLVERFLQEARAASRVRHENIVDITDYGHDADGAPFFAMEYLEGEDLGATITREGALPWTRVKPIVLQILAALTAAHQQGVVHRDMKPDNCFRIARGDNPDFIKVLDFGIAKIINEDSDRQTLTRTGTVIGTAHYMSPEQARSEKLDARADLYSVGVIMFQLLTGQVPFEGSGFLGVLAKHITEPIPSMQARAPEVRVPGRVEELVRRALAKDREHRFQSASEFAAALAAVPDDLVGGPAVRPRARPRMWAVAGVTVAGLAVAGVAAFGGLSGAADPSPKADAGTPVAMPAKPSEHAAETGQPPADAANIPKPVAPVEQLDPAAPTEASAEPSEAMVAVARPSDPPPPTSKPTSKAKAASKPPVAPEPAPLPGPLPATLSTSDMAEALAAAKRTSSTCGAQHPGSLLTTVKVAIVVSPSGTVKSAKALAPVSGTPVGTCAEKAIKGQRFPASQSGASHTVNLPITG